MTETVEALTEESTGVWLIETQGSKHLWNLDEGWYVRNPGREFDVATMLDEAYRGFDPSFNGAPQPLQYPSGDWSVEIWPEVGNVFRVSLPYPHNWHRSSAIKSITRVA